MRRLVRIGGALILGTLLVLGAFYVVKTRESSEVGEVVPTQIEPRDTLEIQDLDNNGIADWKENLDGLSFEAINTPASDTSSEKAEEYKPPTTLTGKFSIALMEDYLTGKIHNASFEDPDAFISTAIEAIDRNTQSKKHSRIEINIVDTNQDSLREYGNSIVDIVASYTFSGDSDLEIVQRAVNTDDREVLEELVPILNAYINTLSDLLVMPVPSELAEKHVELLNGYETIITNLIAMQYVIDDPLYAIARIRNYTDDGNALIESVRTITKVLTDNGVVYKKDEPGFQLYRVDF